MRWEPRAIHIGVLLIMGMALYQSPLKMLMANGALVQVSEISRYPISHLQVLFRLSFGKKERRKVSDHLAKRILAIQLLRLDARQRLLYLLSTNPNCSELLTVRWLCLEHHRRLRQSRKLSLGSPK